MDLNCGVFSPFWNTRQKRKKKVSDLSEKDYVLKVYVYCLYVPFGCLFNFNHIPQFIKHHFTKYNLKSKLSLEQKIHPERIICDYLLTLMSSQIEMGQYGQLVDQQPINEVD